MGFESWCVSWADPRGVGFVDLILNMQRGVSDGVSLPVSGGVSRFLFLWNVLRVVLRRVFPCVGCSVVYGGVARGVRLWCVVWWFRGLRSGLLRGAGDCCCWTWWWPRMVEYGVIG